jgi:hypothetical protein
MIAERHIPQAGDLADALEALRGPILASATYEYGSWSVESDLDITDTICAGRLDTVHVEDVLRRELHAEGASVSEVIVTDGATVVAYGPAEVPEVMEALRGPWRAVLRDTAGRVYGTLAQSADIDSTDIEIAVIRGDDDTAGLGHADSDALYVYSDLCGDFEGDGDVAVRYVQALAVAAALNAMYPGGGPR